MHAVVFVYDVVANAAPNRKNKDENFAMADDLISLTIRGRCGEKYENMRMQTLRNEENTVQSPTFIPTEHLT